MSKEPRPNQAFPGSTRSEAEPIILPTGHTDNRTHPAASTSGSGHGEPNPLEQVGSPAKVMRIGNMIKQLLEEVRNAPLDEKGRARLAEVHERSLTELEEGLSPELVEELRRISLPFSDGETPSDSELRIAQAQLVGWLEGLFHGIQTALVAQQMAAQQQLAQMRKALPGGPGAVGPTSDQKPSDSPPQGQQHGTGQYL